jgi:hypothetical protein
MASPAAAVALMADPRGGGPVRARLVGALLALFSAQDVLVAQGSPATGSLATGSLAGRIIQAGDSTIAAVGANVEIVGTPLRRTAGTTGRFLFTEVSPGSYELRVQAVGYQPVTLRVELIAGQSVEQRIELRRLPDALTEVRIEGKLVKVPARLENVFRRAARGVGKFFTSADIEQLDAYDVQSILGRVPTVSASDAGVTFQRCQAGLPSPGASAVAASSTIPRVQVYVDGMRMTHGGDPEEVNSILRGIRPSQIEIMEVYTGVARIPGEFNNDACAVIAIWRK